MVIWFHTMIQTHLEDKNQSLITLGHTSNNRKLASCWNSVFTLKSIHFSLSLSGLGFTLVTYQKLHFVRTIAVIISLGDHLTLGYMYYKSQHWTVVLFPVWFEADLGSGFLFKIRVQNNLYKMIFNEREFNRVNQESRNKRIENEIKRK